MRTEYHNWLLEKNLPYRLVGIGTENSVFVSKTREVIVPVFTNKGYDRFGHIWGEILTLADEAISPGSER